MNFGKADIYIKKLIVFIALILFVSSFLLYISVVSGFRKFEVDFKPIISNIPFLKPDEKEIKPFASEEEFKNYVQKGMEMASSGYGFGGGLAIESPTMIRKEMMLTPSPAPGWSDSSVNNVYGLPEAPVYDSIGTSPDRISQTNVQVSGIDEPDILKTDGKEIYFSPENQWVSPVPIPMPITKQGITWEEEKRIMPYPTPIPYSEETKIIKAFPPADLALDGKIDKKGNLLLNKNILMIFSGQEINGYDISDPKSPQKKWNAKLENNNYLLTSRLYKNKVYLIARNVINEPRPCPIVPLKVNDSPVSIKCQDIYHPVVTVPVDSAFIAMVLDPATGKIEKTVSFVGSSNSVVYVSENSIYVTYTYNESVIKFFAGFLKENNSMFPSWLAEKINKLNGYDISENAKMMELNVAMEKYRASLSEDEQLRISNELQNKMSDYYEKNKRELEKTGIVRIDVDSFKVVASGNMPGHLLNNFSLDEYKGYLRAATTIGRQWGVFGGFGRGESTNDVYILDKDLKMSGAVKDFGKTEQIYSVRFVRDTGFVVTFRQTDPFFVMDLSNPKNPELKGELKIPGYSSYLHPLDATHILGIGMEGSQVKISLFDVSDKSNPKELDKYLLDEYWTDVSNNYHAFLLDDKHNVFFLPGGKGGYIFSYLSSVCPEGAKCIAAAKYKLELKTAVSQISARRAIYLNDYMYIVGDNKITVLNETDWQKVNEFQINQ